MSTFVRHGYANQFTRVDPGILIELFRYGPFPRSHFKETIGSPAQPWHESLSPSVPLALRRPAIGASVKGVSARHGAILFRRDVGRVAHRKGRPEKPGICGTRNRALPIGNGSLCTGGLARHEATEATRLCTKSHENAATKMAAGTERARKRRSHRGTEREIKCYRDRRIGGWCSQQSWDPRACEG